MRKIVFVLVIIQFTLIYCLQAQIPAGYYDNASNKSGAELKDALYDIINGHTEKSYGDARYILDESDVDLQNSANVLTIYSNHSVSGTWDSGVTWNREHVWAKSRGFGDVDNSTYGPGSDLHNLRACITQINEDRNNRWFAECTSPHQYNGINTGSYISTSEWVWKPRDEDKGDVARILFYMATRYEGQNGEPDLELVDYIPSNSSTTEPIHALFSDLLAWHIQDPVSDFERNRNNVIYSYQLNRNPFIDHPEYVELIWKPTTSLNTQSLKRGVYPNPTRGTVYFDAQLANHGVVLYNIIGAKVLEAQGDQGHIDLNGIPKGQYIMQLKGTQGLVNYRLFVE